MSWLDELEKTLARRVTGLAKDVTGAPREMSLIEICKEVQQQLREKIVSQDRGIRSFPYTRVGLQILTQDDERRAAYDAALNGADPFAERLRALLAEEGCAVRELAIEVVVVTGVNPARPYELTCARVTRTSAKPSISRVPAKLTVIRGEAETSELSIVTGRVNIGRLREVISTTGEMIRVNDLAFKESETTVAREHAFIRWDAVAGRYLLFDALSGGRGTRLLREGESIKLPRGPSKGVALEDGDEIHVGTARIRFELC